MKNKKLPDWATRSIKTFIQSFIAYIFINWGVIHNHLVNWDFSDAAAWLLPLIGGALSAAICAAWNGLKEICEKGGPGE